MPSPSLHLKTKWEYPPTPRHKHLFSSRHRCSSLFVLALLEYIEYPQHMFWVWNEYWVLPLLRHWYETRISKWFLTSDKWPCLMWNIWSKFLTHIILSSFLWDICKQCIPISEVTEHGVCLLTENAMQIWIIMEVSIQKPLKQKWTGPTDKGR